MLPLMNNPLRCTFDSEMIESTRNHEQKDAGTYANKEIPGV
jgi:hypothetical protein